MSQCRMQVTQAQAYQDAFLIENNGAIAGLNEAEQCHQQRALAAARAADHADFGGVGQREGHAIEGGGEVGGVFEADVSELFWG